jgi:hypothetical protein
MVMAKTKKMALLRTIEIVILISLNLLGGGSSKNPIEERQYGCPMLPMLDRYRRDLIRTGLND